MFKNRVLTKTVRLKTNEVTGEWKNCIQEALLFMHYTKYYSSDESREAAEARVGEKRNGFRWKT
jgi:hypothetical protein